jgi:hypothetical protein
MPDSRESSNVGPVRLDEPPDRLVRSSSSPTHALLILEERLKEQEAEGVEMPRDMERDELALRILIAAELADRAN